MNIISNTNISQKPKSVAIILTWLGTIPFIIAALISLSQYIPENVFKPILYAEFKAKALIHSYSVVIASFLAGIQWGVSINQNKNTQFFIMSNVIAIAAWLSLMAFFSTFSLSVILIALIVALFVDYRAFSLQFIPHWFWKLRKKATFVACTSMLIVILPSYF